MKGFAVALGALMVTAGSALALDVSEKIEVKAAPDKVWAAMGDWCGIATWHPVIASCEASEKDGVKMRKLTTKDGAVINEAQKSWDDQAMSFTYSIVDGPLPVANYVSTMKVTGSGDTSTIEWSGTFDAKDAPDDKAMETMTGIYKAGLESIAKKF